MVSSMVGTEGEEGQSGVSLVNWPMAQVPASHTRKYSHHFLNEPLGGGLFQGPPLVTVAGPWDSMKTTCFMNFPGKKQQLLASCDCGLVPFFHWASVSPCITISGHSTQQATLCARVDIRGLMNCQICSSSRLCAWLFGAIVGTWGRKKSREAGPREKGRASPGSPEGSDAKGCFSFFMQVPCIQCTEITSRGCQRMLRSRTPEAAGWPSPPDVCLCLIKQC